MPIVNFDGLQNTNSCANPGFCGMGANCNTPSDDSGAIGPNNYVQTTNFAIAVYDRAGNRLAGPVSTATFFGALPQCALFWTDATVQYDRYADRWIIARFAQPNGNNTPWNMCLAISQPGTKANPSNPAGTYNLYAFQISPTLFPDYPKLGVWSDGYYMTSNANQIRSGQGHLVTAFDRSKLLAGGACPGANCPGMVQFLVADPAATPAGATVSTELRPAFVDGPNLPPAGSPNFLVQIQDAALGFPADAIQVYEARIQWANPIGSTLVTTTAVTPQVPLQTSVCLGGDPTEFQGANLSCLPQPPVNIPATVDPDAAGGPNYRLVYRNWGTYETLLMSLTGAASDDPPNVHAAVKWYELRRRNGGAWTEYQESVHAPDALNRWQGSIAMDAVGNIAVGYVAGGATRPFSVRYAGRQYWDPLGTLPKAERSLAEGSGTLYCPAGGPCSPQNTLSFADYSEMTIDPKDECTFWVTNTYVPFNSPIDDWHTRIGSFRFSNCTTPIAYAVPRGGPNIREYVATFQPCLTQTCLHGNPNTSLFWLGPDGTYYVRTFSSGVPGSPTALTGANFAPAGAGGAAAQQTASIADAFVVGNDGKVYMTSSTNGGPWQPPTPLTSAGFAPPGAALATAWQGGQLGVAAIDNSGALQILWWNAASGWGGPVPVTRRNYAPPGAGVIVGTSIYGYIDMFSIGPDGALKYMAYNSGAWTGPWILTGTDFAPPGAPLATANDVYGYLNVFAVANDGALYTTWECTPPYYWCGTTPLTATGFAPPAGNVAAANFSNQSMNAFLVDNAGTLQVLSDPGPAWSAPTAIATKLADPGSVVSAALESASQLDVFAGSLNAASGIVESVNTGAGWSVPAALP
jgi:hypothetical protein